jgi:hypothetical protein
LKGEEMGEKEGAPILLFSAHAEHRARERGVSLSEVIAAVDAAEIRHPGSPVHGKGRMVYRLGDLAVITDETSEPGVVHVISVMRRWEGGDAA